jgi:hypothetical protein
MQGLEEPGFRLSPDNEKPGYTAFCEFIKCDHSVFIHHEQAGAKQKRIKNHGVIFLEIMNS